MTEAATPTPRSTRDRILEGAIDAVARHGVAKLDMSDVSRSAGVSRGTVYRYFANRRDLLAALSVHEAYQFWRRCLETLERAPEGEQRFELLLVQANRHVREHAALQRMLETDPALVLRAVRREFPRIRDELSRLVAPLLARAVDRDVVSVDHLVDWLTRLMVSAFLIPASDPDEMTNGLTSVYRLLTAAKSSSADD